MQTHQQFLMSGFEISELALLAGKQCEGGLESFILEWEIIMGQDILIF
jgi:hypothetical protein